MVAIVKEVWGGGGGNKRKKGKKGGFWFGVLDDTKSCSESQRNRPITDHMAMR